MSTFATLKDPEATLDYRFDWAAWLDTDTITSSTWAAQSGSDLTVEDAAVVDGTETVVWISGGRLQDWPWRVVNTIVTAAGRREERSLMVTVQER